MRLSFHGLLVYIADGAGGNFRFPERFCYILDTNGTARSFGTFRFTLSLDVSNKSVPEEFCTHILQLVDSLMDDVA